MKRKVALTVNGSRREDEVEPRLLLVHYLRDVAGLTGTHIGCDTSQCGACTVLLEGKAVKSCTMFAVQAQDANVQTIEGLAQGDQLHPLQQAFMKHHALQCGFCTPGFLMLAVGALEKRPDLDDEELIELLSANLCRCTGYENIIKAVRAAAADMKAQR